MKNKEITFGTCVRWGELALVAAILIAVLGKGIQSVEFFGDESNWISTSYFIGPFLKGDIFSPVWQESYATKNQPPVARYIIGVARRIGGFKAKDLNTRWKFDLNDRANFEGGAMPSPDLLWWSRLPMTVFAVVSGGLLFLLVRQAAGRLAGYAVLILFIGNPFLLTTLRRAMAESPLVVFILLAAYAGYRAMRSWRNVYCDSRSETKRSFRPLFWFSLMGIFVGLAAGAKLNGMSVLMAGLGLCVLFPIIEQKFSYEMRYAALYACVLTVAAVTTFVAVNPYLYRNPVKRIQMMIQERLDAMSLQQEAYPAASIHKSSRIQVIRQRVFEQYASLRFAGGEPLNLVLFAVGLAYLVFIARRRIQSPSSSDAAIVILLVAFTAATPALTTPLDWDRYYLLPVIFSTTLIAVGIGCTVNGVMARLPARRHGTSVSHA